MSSAQEDAEKKVGRPYAHDPPVAMLMLICWSIYLLAKNNSIPKINITPENGWLEDYFPFGFRPIFGKHVSFREGIYRLYT